MTTYWDATKIDALKRCPAYFEYSINDRWRPAGGNIHLDFGGALAKAFEIYYRAIDPEDGLREGVRHCMTVPLPPHNTKNTLTLVRSFVQYVDEYRSDTLFTLPDGSKGVEVSFEFDVEDDIVFCGHLDKVIVQDGGIYVCDQKTTGSTISSYFFKNFELSDQMAMYSLVAKEILGSPIRGVYIDGIQIAVGFTRFVRSVVNYPQALLEEWLDDTLYHIRQYDGERWRRWTSCGLYGGCRFRDVCRTTPSLRPKYLKADFKRVPTWQPEVKR